MSNIDRKTDGYSDDDRARMKRTEPKSFLETMTFAAPAQIISASCECDECGVVASKKFQLPPPVALAVQAHKRQRPLKLSQDRVLIKRQDDISVWEWALPLLADPMLEFGSSHRIVVVRRLPGVLKTIGPEGVVGSQQEEQSRSTLDWKEGEVIFVPSNNGKAVGYIHTLADTEATPTPTATFATLIVCKVPSNGTCSAHDSEATKTLPPWHDRLRSLCSKLVNVTLPPENAFKLDETQTKTVLECLNH